MIKLRTIIIILIIYIVSYVSITYNINLLYPYYYLKDIILSPVRAITNDNEITLSSSLSDSIYKSLKDEIEALQKLNNVKTVLSNFHNINATIIERNKEYWYNTITIDRGSIDGITLDMAVIDENGLVGRVSEVHKYTSTIKLITTSDTKNKISVVIKNKEKDVYGILSGYDSKNNLLKVIINENIDIYNKEKVETTGMGGVFPRGILIGEVFDTMLDTDDVTIIVRIRPSSNLEGDKYVSVLQRKEVMDK